MAGGDEAAEAARQKRTLAHMRKWVVDVLVNCAEGWNPSALDLNLEDKRPWLRILPARVKGTAHVVSFPLWQVSCLYRLFCMNVQPEPGTREGLNLLCTRRVLRT